MVQECFMADEAITEIDKILHYNTIVLENQGPYRDRCHVLVHDSYLLRDSTNNFYVKNKYALKGVKERLITMHSVGEISCSGRAL